MSSCLVVHCNFPTLLLAEEVANALVSEGLAACVTLQEGALSVYRWEEKVCKEREVAALIKTSEARYADVEAKILSMHSYSCPEIIAVPIERAHKPYLDWIANETRSEGHPPDRV